MHSRVGEVAAVAALATILVLVVASPVLRAPSERVFGMEIVGRHHDPFTTMTQFDQPIVIGPYGQPVTDLGGALLARVVGGVAAYNCLVLLSFPLSAAAAYLLARHLALDRVGATLAAMAYAFSPFHLAQAAYHAHIAQTEWMPLYLLALWRCQDDATPGAVVLLVCAAIAVTLSSFYEGMIAAVVTPIALLAYWLATREAHMRSTRHLAVTVGGLLVVAGGGMAYALHVAPGILANASVAFPRVDLFLYSARWWSYLVPPVAHPWLGAPARRLWESAGVTTGVLEQQVSVGWAVIALGLVATAQWRNRHASASVRVPALVAVAVAALLCSLSPERTIGGIAVARPSALLYDIVPMFRSYARFGVVVQLMAALLAGIGLDALRRTGTRSAQLAALVLAALVVGEYAVAPRDMWRDVLPTDAHRWIMRQPGVVRALDCVPRDPESASVVSLSKYRVSLLDGSIDDCLEPNLPEALAVGGFTHLIVRNNTTEQRWFDAHLVRSGLRVAGRFQGGQVFAVTAGRPHLYVESMAGFFPREHDVAWTWRWMGTDASWTVTNMTAGRVAATLDLELLAFHHARPVQWMLDGQPLQTVVLNPLRTTYRIGPLTLSPGPHAFAFHAVDAPTMVDALLHNGDTRAISCAIGNWSWSVQGEQL